MGNVESNQFTFDTFKVAYDSDPRIQKIVKNFDKNKIDFSSSAADDLNPTVPQGDDVSTMAKRATDLNDL